MAMHAQFIKRIVAALLTAVLISLPAWGQDRNLDDLFEALKKATPETVDQIEARILTEWSKSGSPAADLLLKRGRDAMVDGDLPLAIKHFTALTDYAPDFAEGWNARATAYYHANLYGPSVDDIARTLELNPRHFGAMSGLALILEELGRKEAALEAWRQVAALNPAREGVKEAIERLERQTEGQSL